MTDPLAVAATAEAERLRTLAEAAPPALDDEPADAAAIDVLAANVTSPAPPAEEGAVAAADEPAGDTYSTAEAAQLLGVSERRVRQMVAEGALPASRNADGAFRLEQEAVNAERARRRAEAAESALAGEGPKRPAPAVDVAALAVVVEAAVGRALAGQRAITERAESLLAAERAALEAERARRLELEVEVATLRARAEVAAEASASAQAEAARRRRWWRR